MCTQLLWVSTLLLSASSRHDRKPSFGIQNILCQHASPSKRWTTLDLGEKFKTVRASDGLQHAKPFWHRYFGSLSAKLETILDGCFTLIHSRQQQLAHEAYISAIIRRGKMTSWHSEFMQWSSHGGTMLLELMQQAESTPRVMSKLRGKCGHQFRCVEGVQLFLVPFNQFVGGPESTLEWDTP